MNMTSAEKIEYPREVHLNHLRNKILNFQLVLSNNLTDIVLIIEFFFMLKDSENCYDLLHNLVLEAKAEAELMAHWKFLGECRHNGCWKSCFVIERHVNLY